MTVPQILDIMHDYIDFVNRQVGAYTDATSGFARNKSIVERQVARILRRTGTTMGDDGVPVVMSTSLEDPTRPDVIMHRIVLAKEYLDANSEGGSNEQQHARAAIIFLFAYWDEEIRPRLARVTGKTPNDIKSNVMGDLRILRKAIIHNKSILTRMEHSKMNAFRDKFQAGVEISLPNDVIHFIFAWIKRDMARINLELTGADNHAPFDISNIDQIAIQRNGR